VLFKLFKIIVLGFTSRVQICMQTRPAIHVSEAASFLKRLSESFYLNKEATEQPKN
jgi:hypothetical protein